MKLLSFERFPSGYHALGVGLIRNAKTTLVLEVELWWAGLRIGIHRKQGILK